jgi:hypothetical protein
LFHVATTNFEQSISKNSCRKSWYLANDRLQDMLQSSCVSAAAWGSCSRNTKYTILTNDCPRYRLEPSVEQHRNNFPDRSRSPNEGLIHVATTLFGNRLFTQIRVEQLGILRRIVSTTCSIPSVYPRRPGRSWCYQSVLESKIIYKINKHGFQGFSSNRMLENLGTNVQTGPRSAQDAPMKFKECLLHFATTTFARLVSVNIPVEDLAIMRTIGCKTCFRASVYPRRPERRCYYQFVWDPEKKIYNKRNDVRRFCLQSGAEQPRNNFHTAPISAQDTLREPKEGLFHLQLQTLLSKILQSCERSLIRHYSEHLSIRGALGEVVAISPRWT